VGLVVGLSNRRGNRGRNVRRNPRFRGVSGWIQAVHACLNNEVDVAIPVFVGLVVGYKNSNDLIVNEGSRNPRFRGVSGWIHLHFSSLPMRLSNVVCENLPLKTAENSAGKKES